MKAKLFIIGKSALKALILLAGGYASFRLTGSWEIGSVAAIVIAPILKFIDPQDDSLGVNATPNP